MLGYVLAGLSSGAAAGLAAAGVAVLTALYLLKLQRRRVVVAHAPLWLPAPGERRSEAWARRLRRWLSLALQVLFLALVLLAAVDPRPAALDRAGRSLVILIDRSASMAAVDEPGGRLAAARTAARRVIDGLGPADRALVAGFASGVSAETGFESDRRPLDDALDRLQPSQEPADLPRALELAAAALRGRPRPTVVLVSDGAYADDARAVLPAGLAAVDLRFAPVGRRAANLALLSFAARRLPADRTSVEAAVTVGNFGDHAADAVLEVASGGRVVERVALHLAPGERRRHVLPDVAAAEALLEARLAPRDEAAGVPLDDLAADDRAYAVVPGLPRRRVLRVGAGNLFLDGALLALGDAVSVRRVSAAEAERTRAEWPGYDAVVFDGVAPAPPPAAGRFLYIDPHGTGSPWRERGAIREPVLSDAMRAHPLLKHLSLADLNVREARRLLPADGDVLVASSLGAPLVLARSRTGAGGVLRAVALAFDLRRSDLPLRAAFPLLLANGLDWLGGGAEDDVVSLRTGRSWRWTAPAGGVRAAVTDPTGAVASRAVLAGAVDVPLPRAGFYRVAPDVGGAVVAAANLADPVESDTRPRRALTLGGRPLPPPDGGPGGGGREPWRVALIAAVALSLFEWVSYHRRWTV